MNYDVIVVGAGAAGLMAAGAAARRGLSVCLLEKNGRPGRKLAITGKGRCNVTNFCGVQDFIASVPTNGRFLYSAVSGFSPQDLMSFLEELHLPLKVERGNRVFPQSDHAADVVDALFHYAQSGGAELVTGEAVRLLLLDGAAQGVELRGGQTLRAKNVIVACGGASYPGTGSTGDGYRLAKQAGHTVTPLRPSLVPLVAAGDDCREMMGLSLKNIAIRVVDEKRGGREVYSDFGEMLFTHFGVSGPVALSASAHLRQMEPGRYRMLLDWKPALSPEKLDARLQRDFAANRNRSFANSLGALLPKKAVPVLVRGSGIAPDAQCNAITRVERLAFARLLKEFPIRITSFRSLEEAIVTSGGVSVKEIEPKTMASRLVSGLYFAGEVIDVDAYTGGFNLQIAFSTGRLAGESAAKL